MEDSSGWFCSWVWTRGFPGNWETTSFRVLGGWLLLLFLSASHHKYQEKAASFTAEWYFVRMHVCACAHCGMCEFPSLPPVWLIFPFALVKEVFWRKIEIVGLIWIILFACFGYCCFKKAGGSLSFSVFAAWKYKVVHMSLFSVIRI